MGEMKTPEQMAKEYVEQEQLEYDEAGGAYYGFLAGYQAAKDEYKVAIDTYNDVGKQMLEEAVRIMSPKDQLADADKVMNSPEKLDSWISVKERLPEIVPTQGMNYWLTSTCVLIATKEKTTHVAHLTHWTREPEADWAACACDTPGHDVEPERWKLSEVTHWMPLPEAPKEEK